MEEWFFRIFIGILLITATILIIMQGYMMCQVIF